jgi:hypothetical protein
MTRVKFSLYQNGLDSIKHAVEHYVSDSVEARRYKYAILHLSQGVLLLLKERLSKEHPNFIFVNVATDPTDSKIKTVDSEEVLLRLRKIAGVNLESSKYDELIRQLNAKRNSIEHYAVDISRHEADSLIVRAIQFLQWFFQEELRASFKEAIGEDIWQKLLKISEYHLAEVTRAKKEIADRNLDALICPICQAETAAVVSGAGERKAWELVNLYANCLVCETSVHGVACLRCGTSITLADGQLPQLYSYCSDCESWARLNFSEVQVRNNNYRYVAEVYRWFQDHDTINAHDLWNLLNNVFTAGSSAPAYPTSLYTSGVIDFIDDHQREDYESKAAAPTHQGIMSGDPYIFRWVFTGSAPTAKGQ